MHVPLFDGVADLLLSVRARAAQRVVPPAGIGHDGEHRVAEIRQQRGAGGQVDIALATMVSVAL